MKTTKHGIELRFGKGRSLKLLSYAVWVDGNCYVDHETTREARKAGSDLKTHLAVERAHYPELPII